MTISMAYCFACVGALPIGTAGEPANSSAVEEVRSGKRTTADAAWWGFDEEDATDILQAAIDSGAKKVIVPYMGKPWIVRPITLRGNLELVLQPGVLVLAKEGEFRGGGDSLFRAADQTDIKIRGYGATLRMRKQDYQQPPYEKAEWRMGLSFVGCKKVDVAGVRVESSGGDGIYIGSSGKNRWCEDVVIRDCVSHDNHRQGISVISAQNLLVENCVLSGTDGTAPEAGIDLEPDSPDERLVNCVIRNCVMEHNSGHAILVYLKPLTSESEPVSIRFENCVARMGKPGMTPEEFTDPKMTGGAGMAVVSARDAAPQGLGEFINCTAENTGKEGAKIFDKSAKSVKVRFEDCNWRNSWVARHQDYGGPRAGIFFHLRRPELVSQPGGVEFVNCHLYYDAIGPAIDAVDDHGGHELHDVTGEITLHRRQELPINLGSEENGITLKLSEAESEPKNLATD